MSRSTRSRSSGSWTETSSRSRQTTDISFADLVKSNKVTGKYDSAEKKRKKLIRQSLTRSYFRWQNISPFDSAGGALKLQWSQAGAAGSAVDLPLHIFTLTGTPQFTAGALEPGQCGWYLRDSSEADSGTKAFYGMGGDSSLDYAYGWNQENITTTGYQPSFPNEAAILHSVHIKMLMYGPVSRPTRFKLDIIQLNQPWLCPGTAPPADSATDFYTSEFNAFWTYMVKPYTYSPLVIQDPKFRRYFKVLASKTVTIEPRTAIEMPRDPASITSTLPLVTTGGTLTPHMHELNWFYKMDRRVRYDWNDNVDVAENNPDFQVNRDNLRVDVTPRARVFLLVRALATKFDQGAVSTYVSCPTYDIMLRKNVHKLSNP